MRAEILVVSTTRARGTRPDTTGPMIAERLQGWGFQVAEPIPVADADVSGALASAVGRTPDLIVTTGGTGLTGDDRTPEATRAVLDREIPGLAEEMRRRGLAATPTAALSRGIVGVAGTTVIANLPGSAGGVRDGLHVLGEVVDHLIAQLHDGDRDAHPRPKAQQRAAHPPPPAATGVVSAVPLDAGAHVRAVTGSDRGAVATFLGIVRDHDGGRTVTGLHYEAHPSAAGVLREVAAQIERRYDVSVAASHRVGALGVGDLALVAAVGAGHRGPAFAALTDLVDTVKATVPIWKRQTFTDATSEWVGLGSPDPCGGEAARASKGHGEQ